MAVEVPSLPEAPVGYPSLTREGRAIALCLFVPGKPVPKGRPRGRSRQGPRGPFVQFYTDQSTVNWEALVAAKTASQVRRLERLPLPFQDRCLVALRFNMQRPKSTPASVKFPVKARTDVDNLAKAVLDALQNAGIIDNDCIVTDLSVSKRYADEDHPVGVEIELTTFSN